MKKLIIVVLIASTLSGCVVNLPFNNRLDFESVSKMKNVEVQPKPVINITWNPVDFPTRIDNQGADGFVGGGSQTRLPTGIAITNRVEEAISQYADLKKSGTELNINVLEARSGFEYSAGLFNVTPGMDVGKCHLKVQITYNGQMWVGEYFSNNSDPKIGASSQTAILEKAWNDVAVQLATDVANHMRAK
ncbi:hypothetical protein V4836_08135 [Kluyvera ascorbata]|uniref:Lipoprotein n=1 Tax=Kluyvera ascorbata TaxID=51288 RepID=A0AB35X6Z6_9ENTR